MFYLTLDTDDMSLLQINKDIKGFSHNSAHREAEASNTGLQAKYMQEMCEKMENEKRIVMEELMKEKLKVKEYEHSIKHLEAQLGKFIDFNIKNINENDH